MLKSRIFLLPLFVVAFMVATPSNAKAEGWLDFFFPTVDNGPKPQDTLRAPFADEDAVIENLDASGESQQVAPLDQRHRTNNMITLWVQQTLPMLLSYDPTTYEKDYSEKVLNLSKVGITEYNGFLQKANYLTTLKTGGYDIAGIIMDYPVIMNEGPVKGRYAWLYQIKTLITYTERGKEVFAKKNAAQTMSKEYVITFQVGRANDADNEHGVLIETWDAKLKE